MTTDNDLALYLKLDDIGQDNKIVDASGKNITATLNGNPTLVPDDKFGSCLDFNGRGDSVLCDPSTVANFDFSQGLTVEAWAYLQSEDATKRAVVSSLEDANSQEIVLYVEDSNLWFKSPGGAIQSALEINKWMHLVATIDQDGNAHHYWNGHRADTGKLQIPSDLSHLRIGGFREVENYGFQGKLAHVRIYTRALTADEIRRDMQRDELAMSSFTASHPLDFRILDRDENTSLYVDDNAADHEMTLEVTNNGTHPVILRQPAIPEFNNAPAGAETLDRFFMENNHLELRFRLGLLSEKSVNLLKEFQTSQFEQPQTESVLAKKLRGWHLFYKEHSSLGSASIYLLRKSEKILKPSDADSDDDMLAVTLSQITANPRGGARNTPFELRPGPLTKVVDGTLDGAPLVGSRVHSISVLSHRGRPRIPLHVGFVGSNTILNDDETASSLTLRITNVSQESIALDADQDSPSRFIITFDEGEVQDMEWAFGDSDHVKAIKVWVRSSLDGIDQQIHRNSENPVEFTIEGENLPDELEANKSIYIRLSNIITGHPTGPANLYLHYENIPGYWDGQFVCPIQKTPLLFRNYGDGNRVGIGTDMEPIKYNGKPTPKLHVDVSNDNASLAADKQKPAAVFEGGNVGIGITSPASKLTVVGNQEQVAHFSKTASFKITEQSLQRLQSEGIPDDVLEKLKVLKNQEVTGKKEFLDILKATIGEEQTVQYESLILKHASKTEGGDTCIVVETAKGKAYIQFKNRQEPSVSWMVGMDDDDKFKIAPVSGEMRDTNADVMLILDSSGDLHVKGRIQDKTGDVMPVGTILSYAGDKAPPGWLLCDGQGGRDPSTYPELFEVIGYRFGGFVSNGVKLFITPDLRGRFLRGWDAGADRDLEKGLRTEIYPGGAKGDAVGSVQEDTFLSHSHSGSIGQNGQHSHSVRHRPMETGGGANSLVYPNQAVRSVGTGDAGMHSHTVTIDPQGGTETRPKNMYVNYIIKY